MIFDYINKTIQEVVSGDAPEYFYIDRFIMSDLTDKDKEILEKEWTAMGETYYERTVGKTKFAFDILSGD